mmetsp:Transcript_27993/g.47443  ORF Transcript_27993/g.47443 Transcript_27993/m.47443 type:complete len:438 (-) Transcript_27993:661-1974(-)
MKSFCYRSVRSAVYLVVLLLGAYVSGENCTFSVPLERKNGQYLVIPVGVGTRKSAVLDRQRVQMIISTTTSNAWVVSTSCPCCTNTSHCFNETLSATFNASCGPSCGPSSSSLFSSADMCSTCAGNIVQDMIELNNGYPLHFSARFLLVDSYGSSPSSISGVGDGIFGLGFPSRATWSNSYLYNIFQHEIYADVNLGSCNLKSKIALYLPQRGIGNTTTSWLSLGGYRDDLFNSNWEVVGSVPSTKAENWVVEIRNVTLDGAVHQVFQNATVDLAAITTFPSSLRQQLANQLSAIARSHGCSISSANNDSFYCPEGFIANEALPSLTIELGSATTNPPNTNGDCFENVIVEGNTFKTPNPYSNNIDCDFTVQNVVRVTFLAFNTEPSYDSLTIQIITSDVRELVRVFSGWIICAFRVEICCGKRGNYDASANFHESE